jgi:probable biosynthetic protein (TIGR04098 family)
LSDLQQSPFADVAGSTWNDFSFVVQMPHLAPGEKLSEVEFLKILAAYQWEAIARVLQRRPSEIVSDHKERLYGSVIDTELCFAEGYGQERLGEDAEVHIRSRVRFFAKKFVEGFFLIDDSPIPEERLAGIESREDLPKAGLSWACMTNAFIARAGGNVRLKVFKPAGADELDIPELSQAPFGITEQARVQSSGVIEPIGGEEDSVPLGSDRDDPIVYSIVPESDLNGAGLVYFARYEAMMNYGERVFLMRNLRRPASRDLVACLSTEYRKVFFFANASPDDEVEVYVEARLIHRDRFQQPLAKRGFRTPFKLIFRIDLYRRSDNMLMASSLVRKALNVPGSLKPVIAESERLLRHLDHLG